LKQKVYPIDLTFIMSKNNKLEPVRKLNITNLDNLISQLAEVRSKRLKKLAAF